MARGGTLTMRRVPYSAAGEDIGAACLPERPGLTLGRPNIRGFRTFVPLGYLKLDLITLFKVQTLDGAGVYENVLRAI